MMTYYLIRWYRIWGNRCGVGEIPVSAVSVEVFSELFCTAKKSNHLHQIIIMSPEISGTMAGNTSGLVFLVLMVTACLIMVSGCTSGNPPDVTVSPTQTPVPVVTTASATPQSCMTDHECVPAQCCHPTSCTNKANKGVCNLMCTRSCEGPIDCGAGSCGCVNGKCSVVPSATSSLITVTKLP